MEKTNSIKRNKRRKKNESFYDFYPLLRNTTNDRKKERMKNLAYQNESISTSILTNDQNYKKNLTLQITISIHKYLSLE
jgi:fido (protein-threonine AMPylation protein)